MASLVECQQAAEQAWRGREHQPAAPVVSHNLYLLPYNITVFEETWWCRLQLAFVEVSIPGDTCFPATVNRLVFETLHTYFLSQFDHL